jgi:O-antigen/teichoic acid export membrane protein
MKWVLLTLGPAVVIMTAFARDILQLWLGLEFALESTPALQILAVGIFINSMVQVQYALVQALGRPDLTAKFHLAQLPLHALLVWWLVGLWGTTGAALAQSIRLAVEALLLLIAACRLAALPFHSLVSDRVLQSSLFLFLCVGTAIGISNLPLVMWLRLAGLGIVFCAVGATVWRYSLDRQDRDQLVKLFWPASM